MTRTDDPSESSVGPSIEAMIEATIEDYLGEEPTQSLADWRRLWEADLAFPLRSHRGFVGRLVVAFKRLLRPLVKLPQSDLWERQRTFNLVLLNMLEARRDRLCGLGIPRRGPHIPWHPRRQTLRSPVGKLHRASWR